MRCEQEMYELILGIAKADERIRAVLLNGSRANPNAPKDKYQDFDIVYIVKDFTSFTANNDWVDIFGERLIMQMPEAMREPSGRGHFNWMILFKDNNRLDLTLIPIEKLDILGNDSDTVVLLDKDNILKPFPPASDKDYITTPPSELFYYSCCNNFWWCLQNVAKGIARDELPYSMIMYHNVVREDLHDMLSWYIGSQNSFNVSTGKMGKYFKRYLSPTQYEKYRQTYSGSDYQSFWEAIFTACDLFRELATEVAMHLGYTYNTKDDDGAITYLKDIFNDA